jgi:pilus assembly protein FimV
MGYEIILEQSHREPPVPDRLRIALLALLAAAPLAASAAGLGRLALFSMVGEPLNAEIEIVSVLPGERDSLSAKLAPTEVYDRAHIAPIPQPDALRVAIERKSDGREVVKVTSAQPLDKPLVNLLVELGWAGGGVVRQYSFLLDSVDRRAPAVATAPPPLEQWRAPPTPSEPPAAAKPSPAPVAAAPAAQRARSPEPATARPSPPPAEPPPAAQPARAPEPAAARPAPPERQPEPVAARAAPAEKAETYAVQSGDSLLRIAQAMRPEGVSTEQMMVAIYRANEDAFIEGSMDRLRGGRTLKIPDRDAAAAVTPDEARKLIVAQRAQTTETRSRPAAAPPTAPAGPSSDDVAALDRALAESKDRAADLEKTLRDLRQLIEGQDKQIEELQKSLGKAPAKAGTAKAGKS